MTAEHFQASPKILPDAIPLLLRSGIQWATRRDKVPYVSGTERKAKSNDPVKLARALEGLELDTPLGPMKMRADNHQLLQPLFVSTLSDKVKYDVEGSGLGFVTDEKIAAARTALPTTCKMTRP